MRDPISSWTSLLRVSYAQEGSHYILRLPQIIYHTYLPSASPSPSQNFWRHKRRSCFLYRFTPTYLKVSLMELLGTLLPSLKFKECFRKAFIALIPERCFVFQVLPLLNSEWDALLWCTTGLLFFWSIFKLTFFSLPGFFPHGDLGLGSWLHLRLLMQLKSVGKSSVLGSPWYGLQFVSFLIRELC